MRFLLGVAEARFFPGIIFYFTYWFPSHHHARIVSCFLIGLPVAVAVGAPISTALLGLDGLFGVKGWQVMYIAEAIPTLVMGVISFFLLTDRPEQAKFLTAEERNWLVTKIASERRATEAVRTFTLWQALYNPTVLLLALNLLGIATGSLGMLIFIPQIIKSLGSYSNMTVGWLTMIPYICGAIVMAVWGRISDRMNERRWNLFIACVFSTLGLVIAGMTMGTWWALVGMSIAAMGFYGSKGPFFAMPPMFLSGAGLAAGIAWINSIGNLGGSLGALVCRRHERPNRQLCGWTLRSRIVGTCGGNRVRCVSSHPEPHFVGRGAAHRRGCRISPTLDTMSASGLVSRVTPVHTAKRNCTRDGGGPFGFGNQVLISSHRKLLSSKATAVNVAETSGYDPGRHGRERRAQANRCRSVEIGLGDASRCA